MGLDRMTVGGKGTDYNTVLVRNGYLLMLLSGSEHDPSTFSAAYTPSLVGLHSVNVFEKRKPLPGSPFPLRVRAQGTVAIDLFYFGKYACSSIFLYSYSSIDSIHDYRIGDDLRAWGRGLAAAGVVAGERVEVNVDHLEQYDDRGQPIETKRSKRDLRGIPVAVKIIDNGEGYRTLIR